MTRKDSLTRLMARLIARRDALRKMLSGDLDALLEVSLADGVGDDADAAIECENHEIFSQLVEIESNELAQIERALERIADGGFDRCEFCGGRICAARMEAVPYATTCIQCQRAHERAESFGVLDRDSKQWAKVRDTAIDEDDDDTMARTRYSDLELDSRQPRHMFSRSVLVA
jgi:DnaK suppressor protein